MARRVRGWLARSHARPCPGAEDKIIGDSTATGCLDRPSENIMNTVSQLPISGGRAGALGEVELRTTPVRKTNTETESSPWQVDSRPPAGVLENDELLYSNWPIDSD